MSKIGSRVELKTDYETAIAKATAALKAEGFGVLTTIDVQVTLKQKLNAEFRRYVILGDAMEFIAAIRHWRIAR